MGLRLNHFLVQARLWHFKHLGLGHWDLLVRLNVVAPLAEVAIVLLLQGDTSRGIPL